MVNKKARDLFSGLFPQYCALCELRGNQPLPLCCDCALELQANSHCCCRCAIPLPTTSRHNPATPCGTCQRDPPPFDRVIAPWLYCERLAHLIQRWKFHRERRLTPMLTSLFLQRNEPGCVDALIPVPLHWRRLLQRGFNQSELFCRQLQALQPDLRAARLDHRGVRRDRATPAQSGMSAAQRRRNLGGAFTVRNRYDNLRVAIVDDVFTTGATATAMASALRRAGAGHIEVWCLARTPAPGS